ncbi:hypothetical protein B0H66DRAFT_641657 [Apodospora peruviana]|uniref:F-box domain-containing protein n=1 Tax=Apodospora peruviana TaxID=516989 RepID=A0AAE0I1J8_9PEZI|nr:hypothetical protein B0H66DRAFT_641657 [Apodospora peruviana]
MLAKLPQEVFDMVAQELPRKKDLKSLSLVNKATHVAVARTLWNSLDLSPSSERALWQFKEKPIFSPDLPAFRLATRLNFHSTFENNSADRCPHKIDVESAGSSKYARLRDNALSIIDVIPARRLLEFSWDLGTCIPGPVLGRHGRLAERQPQLRSLSLTTTGGCMIWDHPNLWAFRDLRKLCWRAPRVDNVSAISTAIRNNRSHLQHLQLDFVDWWRFRDQYYPERDDADERLSKEHFFEMEVLGNASALEHILASKGKENGLALTEEVPSGITRLLPDLRVLSLASVPVTAHLARGFDFSGIKSLTLRKCPGWTCFLGEIMNSGLPIKLSTLEIHDHGDVRGEYGYLVTDEHSSILVPFLNAFEGLEELFFGITDRTMTPAVWKQTISRHGATLRRFVHHLQAWTNDDSIGVLEEELPNLGLLPEEIGELEDSNPLTSIPNLECLGLSCVSWIMIRILLPFSTTATTTQSSLKVLHIRQTEEQRYQGSWFFESPDNSIAPIISNVDDPPSRFRANTPWQPIRPELRDLADWAFGPQGIPSLQVIACGDFGHGRNVAFRGDPTSSSFQCDNMFLCRRREQHIPAAEEVPAVESWRYPGRNANWSIFLPTEADPSTHDWAAIIERNRDALQALPVSPLLDYNISD